MFCYWPAAAEASRCYALTAHMLCFLFPLSTVREKGEIGKAPSFGFRVHSCLFFLVLVFNGCEAIVIAHLSGPGDRRGVVA